MGLAILLTMAVADDARSQVAGMRASTTAVSITAAAWCN
jgi:hypothetical protein